MSGLKEKPIEHSKNKINDDDTLEVIDYAKALVSFIETCSPPITIGIQGDWGSGKTSLLNMIRGSADGSDGGLLGAKRGNGGYLVVNFDAWAYAQFGQEESLPLACMYSLTKKVEEICNNELEKTTTEAFKNTATKLLSKVANVSKFKAAGIEVEMKNNVGFDELAQNMLNFKNEFKGYINALTTGQNGKYKRVVFFIDDLDRVNPRYAVELLESLKNFMDVDNCIFVIAIDYNVVQTGVALKFGEAIQKRSGRSFFDKIIQLPFVMPSSSYNLNRYIITLISEAGLPWISLKKGTKEVDAKEYLQNNLDFDADPIVNILKELTICSVGTNPRQIKRVVNIVKLINIIRAEKSTLTTKSDKNESLILYGLICMQVAWPEIFSIFSKNPTYETFARLEDWDYLNGVLPDIYTDSNSTEIDFIKNQLSVFADTFISLIDTDGDGSVTSQEFLKVKTAMQKAKLTAVTSMNSPKDDFIIRIKIVLDGIAIKHKAGMSNYLNALERSKWMTSYALSYNCSSPKAKYISILKGKRQVGTLVSLKSRPIILRLKGDFESTLKALNGKYSDLILEKAPQDSSMTGFGDLIIDFMANETCAEKISHDRMLEALNTLYENLIEKQ